MADSRSPAERRILRSFEDPQRIGRPLSRATRQTQRSLEGTLRGAVMPRFMQRLNEIERAMRAHEERLAEAYDDLRAHERDDERFAHRWRELARGWSFEELNQLIREHNEWYPIERELPMDPRTRDYVKVCGRSYRREELGPGWILERFPPVPRSHAA